MRCLSPSLTCLCRKAERFSIAMRYSDLSALKNMNPLTKIKTYKKQNRLAKYITYTSLNNHKQKYTPCVIFTITWDVGLRHFKRKLLQCVISDCPFFCSTDSFRASWLINTMLIQIQYTMHWSLAFHGKLSFAVIFSAHFLVLYPRQPWSLNKEFIHHMSCINKQNKIDKTNSGNCESKMSDWGILIFFPPTASHLSALLKIQFNCISSAYIMMKHCLLLNYFFVFFAV